jgi:transcription-repair coupling factor (superfamily II helicase)
MESVAELARGQPDAGPVLADLVGRIERQAGFSEVLASLATGNSGTLGGVWGSSCALIAASLAAHAPRTLVVVCAHADDLDDFNADLALFTNLSVAAFPAWERNPREPLAYDEIYGDRLRLLKQLRQPMQAGGISNRVIVTSIQSLLQPVPRRATLDKQTRPLAVGQSCDANALASWLIENGFQSTSAVELPGEFSLRGGILDIFAADWLDPVRIEFFGDEAESIRRFEVSSQRSLMSLPAVEITAIAPSDDDREHFCNYLPPDAWFMLLEPADLEEEGRHYLDRLDQPEEFHSVATTLKEITKFPSVTASGITAGSLDTTCHLQLESVERFSGDVGRVRDELDALINVNDLFIVCQTEAESARLQELFRSTRLAAAGNLHFPVGHLKSGFRLVPERIAVLSGGELFHREDLTRPTRGRRLGRVIDSFLELREGDYVVHLSHGIGRYRGMRLLEKEGQAEEHLVLEFHGSTRIYVPASKIELVQKYVGGSKTKPSLAHIGGKSWTRQKQAAEEAVNDLAVDMLELQARRAARPGIGFGPDTPWQQEFDASFPYTETTDQLSAIKAIKGDMRHTRPMDRLLCGDVGFGKTEVAMRAAFKAVDSGYQVAVLVPTTILAEQHHRTFSARMAEFPFTVRSLSRFCTAKEEKQILEGLKSGAVDVVIGTHRLAQHDITFNNLGLLVIDEEQRFGVDVKERLKALRSVVDVLTMTATPIPRTLHLSLLGLRDISNLETAPADRLAVETRVVRFDAEMVRHAILRELSRGGQIYFVHNRVHDIERVAQRLQEIAPEASIRIGHGQMNEAELERVMLDFVAHKYDILLATTIIESGLDIPNANTIFIDEADRYGLADLHQLRGRVGRYKHRAYCYLLVDPNRHLPTNAARRLRAIEEFSDMGAGFAIAMRDLELRGAGNILGTQQSGHIATVGYELYCQLLDRAVRKLKQLPPQELIDVNLDLPGNAFLPRSYIPDLRLKIDLYRRLARVATQSELDELSAELIDRFGPRPVEVDRLLSLAELRIWAHYWGIDDVHLEDAFAVMRYADRQRIEQLAARSKGRLRIVDGQSAYLPLGKTLPPSEEILQDVKSLLRPS